MYAWRIITTCIIFLLTNALWAQSKQKADTGADPFAGKSSFTVDLRAMPDTA